MSDFPMIAVSAWSTLGTGLVVGAVYEIRQVIRARRLVAFCRSGREW